MVTRRAVSFAASLVCSGEMGLEGESERAAVVGDGGTGRKDGKSDEWKRRMRRARGGSRYLGREQKRVSRRRSTHEVG